MSAGLHRIFKQLLAIDSLIDLKAKKIVKVRFYNLIFPNKYKKIVSKFKFQVSCLMDANPATELIFKWKFNTTSNTVDIPVSRVAQNVESARYANLPFFLALNAYFNVSRQKVPYFNVSRQKVSYFNVSRQKVSYFNVSRQKVSYIF